MFGFGWKGKRDNRFSIRLYLGLDHGSAMDLGSRGPVA